MQTFLPYADFGKSAACLDNKRLNKQIIECKQILMALDGKTKGWRNHPAVLMWKGHQGALFDYALCCAEEYRDRAGHPHSLHNWFLEPWNKTSVVYPRWIGYEPFHSMHRAVLLDKDPEWYSQFDWTEKPAVKVPNGSRMSYPYVWPSKMELFNPKDKQI